MNKLLFLLSLTGLMVNTTQNYQFTNEIIQNGYGNTVIDPNHLVYDSKTETISYDSWIPWTSGGYSIFCDTLVAHPKSQKLIIIGCDDYQAIDQNSITFEGHYYDDNADQDDILYEVSDVKNEIVSGAFAFRFDLDDCFYGREYRYFTLYSLHDDSFKGKDKEFFKKNMYMTYNSYIPKNTNYIYNEGYRRYWYYRADKTIIAETGKKYGLNVIKNNIITTNKTNIELVYDEYSSNYEKDGTYKLTYKVNEIDSGKEASLDFYIINYTPDIPTITCKNESCKYTYRLRDSKLVSLIPEVGTYKSPNGVENIDVIIPQIESDFTFGYGKSNYSVILVMKTKLDLNKDGVADVNPAFATYYNIPGVYEYEWQIFGPEGKGVSGIVARKSFTIEIVDDSDIEIFVPDYYLLLDDALRMDNQTLTKHLKDFIQANNIKASNICLLSPLPQLDETGAGNYEIKFSYEEDGKTYYSALNLGITDNEETRDVDVKKIVCVSLSTIIVLGAIVTALFLKAKNRKKYN